MHSFSSSLFLLSQVRAQFGQHQLASGHCSWCCCGFSCAWCCWRSDGKPLGEEFTR